MVSGVQDWSLEDFHYENRILGQWWQLECQCVGPFWLCLKQLKNAPHSSMSTIEIDTSCHATNFFFNNIIGHHCSPSTTAHTYSSPSPNLALELIFFLKKGKTIHENIKIFHLLVSQKKNIHYGFHCDIVPLWILSYVQSNSSLGHNSLLGILFIEKKKSLIIRI